MSSYWQIKHMNKTVKDFWIVTWISWELGIYSQSEKDDIGNNQLFSVCRWHYFFIGIFKFDYFHKFKEVLKEKPNWYSFSHPEACVCSFLPFWRIRFPGSYHPCIGMFKRSACWTLTAPWSGLWSNETQHVEQIMWLTVLATSSWEVAFIASKDQWEI